MNHDVYIVIRAHIYSTGEGGCVKIDQAQSIEVEDDINDKIVRLRVEFPA